MTGVDESFKKPGAIPFNWEVRPGVPKLKHCYHQNQLPEPCDDQYNDHDHDHDHFRSCYSVPSTPRKLAPPPSSCFTPPPNRLRSSSSLRSLSTLRSDKYHYEPPLFTQPEMVSTGCFLSPWLRRIKPWGKKRSKSKSTSESEPNYTSEHETPTRWSVSTRKSISPWSDSRSSSSFSSHRSSPRAVGDSEWAGFGLF